MGVSASMPLNYDLSCLKNVLGFIYNCIDFSLIFCFDIVLPLHFAFCYPFIWILINFMIYLHQYIYINQQWLLCETNVQWKQQNFGKINEFNRMKYPHVILLLWSAVFVTVMDKYIYIWCHPILKLFSSFWIICWTCAWSGMHWLHRSPASSSYQLSGQ
jgi:hypothetical protein